MSLNVELFALAVAFGLPIIFYSRRSVRLLTAIRDELSKFNAKTMNYPK